MNPTEHELTVATLAIARTVHNQLAATTPVGVTPATFDQLGPMQRHRILEAALPLAVAALDALPDRAESALAPILALVDETPVRCSCADNEFPGYVDDEGWEPEFPGDRRSLTGRGYLDCPWCDGEGNRTPDAPTRDEIRAAIDRELQR